jgi:site-specific DNA recombinase
MQLKPSLLDKAARHALRIVCYLRVSDPDSAVEGDSIPAQRNYMQRIVDQWREAGVPIESVDFYEEMGKSGKNLKRPEFLRMEHTIRKGTVDVVLAFKIDRLSRNTDDFRGIERLLDEHGVELLPINDMYDPSNAQGWFMSHMTIGQAEYERRVIGERTRLAMEYRAKQGMWNGGFLFGYRKDEKTERLVIHPGEAEIIRRDIYDTFERQGSVGKVLEHLQNHGIMYPNKRSSSGDDPDEFVPFQKQRIRRILENEVYLGHTIWGNATPKGRKSAKVVRTENSHAPIIAKEQFVRVQRQLNQNRKRRTNTRYARGRQSPLKGLIRCACGCHMVAKGGTGRNETHHYYGCTRRNHEGKNSCNSPAFRADALETAVINRLKRISTSPEARQRIAAEALRHLGDDAQRIERELGLVRQRLGTVQTEINNLTKAIARMGAEAAELVEEELVQRKQERDQLRGQAAELEREKAPRDVVEERAKRFIEQWSDIGQLLDDATLEEQRVILQHLVEMLELKMVDQERKRGTYVLKLFPEVGRLVSDHDPHASGPPADESEKNTKTGFPQRKTGPVLTENGLVRQFGKKAPRLGLEPRT